MKLLLVDDHTLFREGMSHVLRGLDPDVTVLEAGNCVDALALADQHGDLAVMLLDLALPGEHGMACLRTLRERAPLLPVVVLSASESRDAMAEAMRLGASGYLTKSSSATVVLRALRLVLAGGIYVPYELTAESDAAAKGLTERQLEVLKLLVQGKPNKEIALFLGMAEPTVRVHVTAILKHLEVANRTEAALKALRLGIVSPN